MSARVTSLIERISTLFRFLSFRQWLASTDPGSSPTGEPLTARVRCSAGLTMVLICLSTVSPAETSAQSPLYADKTGAELRALLVADFKASTVLPVQQAKDTMFAVIDNDGGVVRCVYTGFEVALDGLPTADPSQDVLNPPDQDTDGLNNEHTWPQSLGAGTGNAHSDLHHIFPSKVDINFDRASLPFGDIANADVDAWYFEDAKSMSPIGNPDENSRLAADSLFEPRDDHKGNVARAMFYFYTMYEAQADADFFESQKSLLRMWHELDPADTAELARSAQIATYQDGKQNPYVLDATLVDRAFFDDELPVILTSFDAVVTDNRVVLRWETASEVQNAGFEIEVDRYGSFQRAATVEGTGSTGAGARYVYSYDAETPGMYRFRLRQFDHDGSVSYSSVLEVSVSGATLAVADLWPNPATEFVTLHVTSVSGGPLTAFILDQLGRQLKVIHIVESETNVDLTFPVHDVAAGVYVIRVQQRDQSVARHFVVVR